MIIVFLVACATRTPALEQRLEAEVSALRVSLRAAEQLAATCDDADGPPPPVFHEVAQVFAGTEVVIGRRGSTTWVRLPATWLFSEGAPPNVRDEAKPGLDLLAMVLAQNPELAISVIGHSESVSVPMTLRHVAGDGMDLGWEMARTLVAVLVTGYDVDPSRFTVSARGPWEPVVSSDLPAATAANRRVEVLLAPRPR